MKSIFKSLSSKKMSGSLYRTLNRQRLGQSKPPVDTEGTSHSEEKNRWKKKKYVKNYPTNTQRNGKKSPVNGN